MPRFQDISQMSTAHYAVNVGWEDLDRHISRWRDRYTRVVLDPDYQRGNVWTRKQQAAFLEYALRGGISGKSIFWNCPGWMKDFRGPLELVDGKQRITAVLQFLKNKVKVFGYLRKDYIDKIDFVRHNFLFHVNDLSDRKDVIQWYLDLNSGTPHSRKDIKKAEELLRLEPTP